MDSGPIVGVESFAMPHDVSVRELEQMAFVRLAHLFWRMSKRIACEAERLPTLAIGWSGTKSTRRMYQEFCKIPADISAAELKRRIRAFDDDFRAIPLTVSLHGTSFKLIDAAAPKPEAPEVEAPPLAIAS